MKLLKSLSLSILFVSWNSSEGFVSNVRQLPSRVGSSMVHSVATAEEAIVEDIVTPKGSENKWEVHKFGGASLATAHL